MKFEKLTDGLFTPLQKSQLSKIRGGYADSCTTVVMTARWLSSKVKDDGTEQEEDPAAVE